MSTSLGHDRAGELGVATVEPDVDRADEMAVGELLGVAAVEEHGAVGDAACGVGQRRATVGMAVSSSSARSLRLSTAS